jgi:hypothetical protein
MRALLWDNRIMFNYFWSIARYRKATFKSSFQKPINRPQRAVAGFRPTSAVFVNELLISGYSDNAPRPCRPARRAPGAPGPAEVPAISRGTIQKMNIFYTFPIIILTTFPF